MIRLYRPFDGSFLQVELNETLHGRSVHRRKAVPGHDVDKGYNRAGTGDALDAYLAKGTPIYSPIGGTVTRMCDPHGRLDDCWIEGTVLDDKGKAHDVVVVVAHLHYKPQVKVGGRVRYGQIIGFVAGEVKKPHLHIEIWIDGKSVSAPTPEDLAVLFEELVAPT